MIAGLFFSTVAALTVQADHPLPNAMAPPDIAFGARLEKLEYPWPVRTMKLDFAGEPVEIAYMDLTPPRPNGRAVVLLHGRTFCGASWESTARALVGAGYRVLIPDLMGTCKSSKPRGAQFSLELLAAQTKLLMETRGITRASLVGHSLGATMAMRFAILYPDSVDRMVLVSPLGLVDRSTQGLPYATVNTLLAEQKKVSYASLKAYQQANFYHGTWNNSYDRWVWILSGMYKGAALDQVALSSAKIIEMIETQPVAYELGRIKPPTVVMVGALDKHAFGRDRAPATLQQYLTPIPAVAAEAVRKFPNARLVSLDGLGHVPQIEAPDRFEKALLGALTPRP